MELFHFLCCRYITLVLEEFKSFIKIILLSKGFLIFCLVVKMIYCDAIKGAMFVVYSASLSVLGNTWISKLCLVLIVVRLIKNPLLLVS